MSTGDPFGQFDDSEIQEKKKKAIEGRNKRFTVMLVFVSFGIGVVGLIVGVFAAILGSGHAGLAGLAFGVIGIGNGFRCLMDLFRDPEKEKKKLRKRAEKSARRSERDRESDRPRRSTPSQPEKYDDDDLDIK
jgi:hypothetical protein